MRRVELCGDCWYVPPMSAPPRFASALLDAAGAVRHGFYGRRGGVSAGVFASLNGGRLSGDRPALVRANLARVADDLGGARLFTNRQVHGARVRIITTDADPDEPFEGDGMVTREAGLCLGVLAADCAPVLFADPPVIGTAHAGWRGALLGVTDAVIGEMTRLGARPERIVCAIGPAIQARSYRVGAELVARFRTESPFPCEDCFHREPTAAGDHHHFDLPRYLRLRIARAGIAAIDTLADDTFRDEARFFSYRRSSRRGEADYGRQISAIALPPL